jgi:hypothetical protein
MTEHKRRFWQIHLSTAIVSMFVAATLLWMQFQVQSFQGGYATLTKGTLTTDDIEYGWPANAARRQVRISPPQELSDAPNAELLPPISNTTFFSDGVWDDSANSVPLVTERSTEKWRYVCHYLVHKWSHS